MDWTFFLQVYDLLSFGNSDTSCNRLETRALQNYNLNVIYTPINKNNTYSGDGSGKSFGINENTEKYIAGNTYNYPLTLIKMFEIQYSLIPIRIILIFSLHLVS